MTSEARDAALLGGEPLELYRFTRGVLSWRYTNADRLVTYNDEDYAPAAIARGKINEGGEPNKASLTITMPKDLEVAGLWRPYPPSGAVGITVWSQHVGETDYLVDWIGRITAPKYDDKLLTLSSDPSRSTGRRNGRGRTLQRGCDLLLFSQGRGLCNVDQALHAIGTSLDTVDSTTLTATGFLAVPSGRLAGGWIEWTASNGNVEQRDIESHTGNSVQLMYGAPDLVPTLAVTVYPGCGQTWDDCVYYDNTDNYGGELFIPGRNYFDGNVVR